MHKPYRNDYVIPAIAGRIGNNLFMIANAYARALDWNKPLYVCKDQISYFNGVTQDKYSENIFRRIDFIDKFPEIHVNNPAIPSDSIPTVYSGYYQSEKFFSKYSEFIISMFGPTHEFIEEVRTKYQMLTHSNNITAINVRRGDYLHNPNYHPVITVEYILEALKRIPVSDYYFIASDDIAWCKENIHLNNMVFIEGYNSYEQLWLLSLCNNFVISNSSFSWWAAYLSRNPNKIVVAPATWFGPDHHADWEDTYCKNWIKLPTFFKDGKIFPKDGSSLTKPKISVLTLTYLRHHILEEAISSFLHQNGNVESEMVIINDSDTVEYTIDHPQIRVINLKDRFATIADKIKYGYQQCKYDYVYRLDDDDLLAPWALQISAEDIEQNPGYEIYRSNAHYFFSNNLYTAICDNINNGNIYTKSYLDRIEFPNKSGDEDADITFHHDAKIFTSDREQKTMLYRWGMGTYHISGWGQVTPDTISQNTDSILKVIGREQSLVTETGIIKLEPKFTMDYYSQLPIANK